MNCKPDELGPLMLMAVQPMVLAVRPESGIKTFLYLPFGAPHCPFHAPKKFIERYRGRFDDRLVLFRSDNGASQERQASGVTNTERFRNLMPMSVQEMLRELDAIGGPDTDPHYPHIWAMAGNTPFRRYKRDTHRGGNADPLIAHWPARMRTESVDAADPHLPAFVCIANFVAQRGRSWLDRPPGRQTGRLGAIGDGRARHLHRQLSQTGTIGDELVAFATRAIQTE